ncbi:hypothetical protein MRB53_041328 [Persea americana]|nr:hypothetical protein MRB53_041328 [Persea americana]
MQQLMQNGGLQMQGPNRGNFQGGQRGGRGGAHGKHRQQHNSNQPQQAHAVNGRLPDGPLQPAPHADSNMEVDSDTTRSNLFDTLCRFNLSCTNPGCGFAHQSPVAPPNTTVDLTDTCSFGVNCANTKCSGRHPSQRRKRSSSSKKWTANSFPIAPTPAVPSVIQLCAAMVPTVL